MSYNDIYHGIWYHDVDLALNEMTIKLWYLAWIIALQSRHLNKRITHIYIVVQAEL